jgi:hypothetical protein
LALGIFEALSPPAAAFEELDPRDFRRAAWRSSGPMSDAEPPAEAEEDRDAPPFASALPIAVRFEELTTFPRFEELRTAFLRLEADEPP